MWERLGLPIKLICPSDNPVSSRHPVTLVGHRQHHGRAAIERFALLLHQGVQSGHPYILFNEYDSLLYHLPEAMRSQPGVHGFVWTDGDPRNGFVGRHFIHPPIFMDRGSAASILSGAAKFRSLGDERGFWDRWLGMICEKARVPMHTTERHHFTRNTIEQSHLGMLLGALKAGATWFHGVKSQEAFNMIDSRLAQ